MTQPVKCACGSLFGIEQPDGSLAIKYRDLFRIVRGSVSGPCRKCGATVDWPAASSGMTLPPVWWTSVPPTFRVQSFTCNCACQRCLDGDCCMVPA